MSSSSITSVSSESVMDGQVSSLALGFGWFGDDAGLVDLAVTLAGSAGLVGVVCFAGNVDLVGKVFLVCLVGVVGMRKPLSIHPWGSRVPPFSPGSRGPLVWPSGLASDAIKLPSVRGVAALASILVDITTVDSTSYTCPALTNAKQQLIALKILKTFEAFYS